MKKMLSMMLLLVAVTFSNSWSSVVGHTGKYFTVTEHDRSFKVGRESLDGTLRNVNKANLALFMKKGRVSAHKTNDGSYVLRGHVHGLGGGPMLASFAYWATKSLCWGGVAAAGGAVVATGVGAGVALAGGGTLVGTAGGMAGAGAGLLIDSSIAATGIATGGANIVAGGLAYTAAGSALAAEGTVALVTASAGTSLGFFGTIEALSLAAYAGALALPTP